MKHVFGLNEYLYRQKNTQQNVVINTQELINGHVLLTGMSGTSKSHQVKRLIKSAIQQNLQVDIFDVQNKLDQPDAYSALYSDPHSGGVRRRINEIINMVNATRRDPLWNNLFIRLAFWLLGYGLSKVAYRAYCSEIYSSTASGCYKVTAKRQYGV